MVKIFKILLVEFEKCARLICFSLLVIYKGERETSSKYSFAAQMEGIYYYCFSNKMSSMTPKIVKFNIDIGDPPKDRSKEDTGMFLLSIIIAKSQILTTYLECCCNMSDESFLNVEP